MKRVLLTILLLGLFIFLPLKSMAMLEVDENGNPVAKEEQPGEATTLIAPDEGVSSDAKTGSGEGTVTNRTDGNDTSTKASDEDEVVYTARPGEEIYQATAIEEDAVTISAKEDKAKTWPTALLYGGIGVLLGILGTCFVISRRK